MIRTFIRCRMKLDGALAKFTVNYGHFLLVAFNFTLRVRKGFVGAMLQSFLRMGSHNQYGTYL
jgi:hypothetical protein